MPEEEQQRETCTKEKTIQLSDHAEVTVSCCLGKHHDHGWHVAWQIVDKDTEVMFRWH